MRVIDLDVTTRQRGGGGVMPQRSMGLVSTTIALAPMSIGSVLPVHGAAEADKMEGESKTV